jgi:hypothetical protein
MTVYYFPSHQSIPIIGIFLLAVFVPFKIKPMYASQARIPSLYMGFFCSWIAIGSPFSAKFPIDSGYRMVCLRCCSIFIIFITNFDNASSEEDYTSILNSPTFFSSSLDRTSGNWSVPPIMSCHYSRQLMMYVVRVPALRTNSYSVQILFNLDGFLVHSCCKVHTTQNLSPRLVRGQI